jgi:hypothetical protein
MPHPLKAFLSSKVTLHYLEEKVLEWDRIRLLVSFTIFFSSISEMGEPLLHKIFKFPFQRFLIEFGDKLSDSLGFAFKSFLLVL